MKKIVLLGLYIAMFCLMACGYLQAQIVDDSTKAVYSTKTTRLVYEKDVFENRDTLRYMDTSLTRFHLYDKVRQQNFLYQDLGHNHGTPLKPVFYQLPQQIGVQWGFDTYQALTTATDDIRYYDTRSPFTNFYFALGGQGQQIVKVEFSRNINKNLNFGFVYKRTNASRQYGSTGIREQDAILEQYNASVFVRYISNDKRYQLLTHFGHFNSQLQELGGINLPQDSLYVYQEAPARLSNTARSWQTQNRYRLYHEYKVDELLRVFQSLEYFRQRDTYTDFGLENNLDFYGANLVPRFNADTTIDDYVYRLYTQQIGIKGKKGFINYWAYFKSRFYSVGGGYEDVYSIRGKSENFVGGRLNFNITDSILFDFQGEYLLGRDYMAKGEFRSSFFTAGVKSVFFSPTQLQNRYVSNLFTWENNFENSFANEIYGRLHYRNRFMMLSPFARYQILNNHVYFTKLEGLFQPVQEGSDIQILQIGTDANFRLGNFHLENSFYYTENAGGSEVIRFPQLSLVSRLYLEGSLFKKAIFGRVGIDMHYRSAYQPDAYMPVVKQFWVQDDFLARPYPLIDLYVSLRIKKARGYIRVSHINQGLLPPPLEGYAVTPFYAGTQRSFGFGIDWLFFD